MTANPTATRTTPFGHLVITWDDRVLEPRSWTEAQSMWAAELLTGAPEGPVLELCAGAGQIGLLTIALAPCRLVCVDLDPAAGPIWHQPWDMGYNPHDEVDRAIMATRQAVFALHGLDVWFD